MMDTVLALDFGTQGVKALLVDTHGALLARRYAHYPFSMNRGGLMEQRPGDWVDAAIATIASLRDCEGFQHIAAVGLSGHMHGVVPLDASGAPTYDCILWCDTRCGEQLGRVGARLSSQTLSSLQNPLATAYTMGKLVWLREHVPQAWDRTRRVLYCKDYIRFLLTGEQATDYSDASGSLLYDFAQNCWSLEACEAAGISPVLLPQILSSCVPAGRVTQEAARSFGLPAGIPVAVGSGDLAASLLGSGVSGKGELLINLGTAGQVLAVSEGTRKLHGGYRFKFLDDTMDMLLFSLPSAAYCVRWYVEQIEPSLARDAEAAGIPPFEQMHRLAARAPAGAGGLLFAPYLSGSGSPHFDDAVRGAWIGLDSAHTHEELCRSILEGVAYGVRQCVEESGCHGEITLSGGGAQSALWRRILADVLGRTLLCPKNGETTGIGAAIMAMRAVGIDDAQVRSLARVGDRIDADPNGTEKYGPLYQRFTRLYELLRQMKQ